MNIAASTACTPSTSPGSSASNPLPALPVHLAPRWGSKLCGPGSWAAFGRSAHPGAVSRGEQSGAAASGGHPETRCHAYRTVLPALSCCANASRWANCRKPARPVLVRQDRPGELSSAAQLPPTESVAPHPAARRDGLGDTGALGVGPRPAAVSSTSTADTSRPPPVPARVFITSAPLSVHRGVVLRGGQRGALASGGHLRTAERRGLA